MNTVVRNIAKDFVVVSPDKNASVEKADSGLYQRLEKNYAGFKSHELVAAHEFTSDWNTWEMHPHGDEIVLLLAGEVTLVLQLPDGEESATLIEAGSYIIVPSGVWHTARTKIKSRLLFITPGEGTQNKEEP